jgi:aquaporin Z
MDSWSSSQRPSPVRHWIHGREGVTVPLSRRVGAEFIGTFWLVFGGCGSAVLAASFPEVGIGLLGVALAFGLTVLTMAYAIGHISGCHLNPAVFVGGWALSQLWLFWVAPIVGAILAGLVYPRLAGRAKKES